MAGPADDETPGVEHDLGELEPVAHLRERERVAVRHHPMTDVALGVPAAEVHRGGAAGIGGPAGGEQEQRDREGPHPVTTAPLRG